MISHPNAEPRAPRNEREAATALASSPPARRNYAEGVADATARLQRQFAATSTVLSAISFVLGMAASYLIWSILR